MLRYIGRMVPPRCNAEMWPPGVGEEKHVGSTFRISRMELRYLALLESFVYIYTVVLSIVRIVWLT